MKHVVYPLSDKSQLRIFKLYYNMEMVKNEMKSGLNNNIPLELHHVANFILTWVLTAELFLERKGLPLHVFEIDRASFYL